MTPLAPDFGTSTSAVTEYDLFCVTTSEPSLSRHMPPNRICELPLISCGRPARSGLKRSNVRSSSGSTLYLVASIRKSRCSSASFSGFSLARSCDWVQSVFVSYSSQTSSSNAALVGAHPRDAVPGHRGPALVIDAAVAEHLEVLRLVPLGRLGIVERIQHADALERRLLHAVDECRVRECPPLRGPSARRRSRDRTASGSRPCALMPFGQCTIVPLRVPPKCDATCLVHWYGVSIACAQPTA